MRNSFEIDFNHMGRLSTKNKRNDDTDEFCPILLDSFITINFIYSQTGHLLFITKAKVIEIEINRFAAAESPVINIHFDANNSN